jgi:hypothetical protein
MIKQFKEKHYDTDAKRFALIIIRVREMHILFLRKKMQWEEVEKK